MPLNNTLENVTQQALDVLMCLWSESHFPSLVLTVSPCIDIAYLTLILSNSIFVSSFSEQAWPKLRHTHATSSTAGEKDLKWRRAHNEKTDTYNLASGESGSPLALHDRKTKWLLSACTFIGRSHMRSLGNSYPGELD